MFLIFSYWNGIWFKREKIVFEIKKFFNNVLRCLHFDSIFAEIRQEVVVVIEIEFNFRQSFGLYLLHLLIL